MTVETGLRSPLLEMVETTPTDYWNDSCSIEELTYAIANGAVGATSNPTIVGEVLAKEMETLAPPDRRACARECDVRPRTRSHGQLIEEMADERVQAPAAGVRTRARAQGAPVDPDQPEALP